MGDLANNADYLGNAANRTEQFVKQCNDGSWCCEAQIPPLNNLNNLNSTLLGQVNACCDQGKGLFIDNGKITNVNPKGTATSSSPTATATKTSPSPTPSSPSSSAASQNSSHAGAIAGGTVGGIASLVIIAMAIFFYIRWRRKPKSQELSSTPVLMPEDGSKQEMDGIGMPYEKYGSARFEKDGVQLSGGRGGPHEI